MEKDFSKYFAKYDELVEKIDAVFEKVKADYPEEVKCKEKCADCCSALFDLTLVEALHINHRFLKKFTGEMKKEILEKANKSDRKIHVIKKQTQKDIKNKMSEVEILSKMAVQRVRCPFLNEDDKCDLYEHRPITCRIYGIPTSSNGMSHTCGDSGFEEGKPYPAINMDTIHKRLFEISAEIVADIQSKYGTLAGTLVPLSSALLTRYDDEFLGTKPKTEESDS